MSFAFLDYLKTYRKEDVSTTEMLIRDKWLKTSAIIKEAFSDKFVTKNEAIRKLRDDFQDANTAPKTIDVSFLKENTKYVADKIRDLSEGDIRIIINNGDKKALAGLETEGCGKRGRKKIEEKKKDDEEEVKEIIVDEPAPEEITPEEVVKEVLITFDQEKMVVTLQENGEVIDTLEVTEENVESIMDFLKTFYEHQEYIVTSETVGEKVATDEKSEEEGEESEETMEVEPEQEIEFEESVKPSLSFAKYLKESEEAPEVAEDQEPITVKVNAKELIGKAVMCCNEWYVVKDVSEDGETLTVLDKDGQQSTIKKSDIQDYEREVLEPVEEDVVMEATYKGLNARQMSLIKAYVKSHSNVYSIDDIPTASQIEDINPHELFWQAANRYIGDIKNLGESVKLKSASLTAKPFKPAKNVVSVAVPKSVKKGISTSSITAKPTKTEKKIEDVKKSTTPKKGTSSAALTKSPSKPNVNISGVKVPSTPKKAASKGSFTSKSNMKPAEKHAK